MTNARILLPAAVAAVGFLAFFNVPDAPVAPEAPALAALAKAESDAVPGEFDRRAAARTAHATAEHEITALPTLSREERLAAIAEENQMAEHNRQVVFETNILNLHAAAAEAEEDGNHARAALMRKRAERLQDRMIREAG